jgi:hypothetical protein
MSALRLIKSGSSFALTCTVPRMSLPLKWPKTATAPEASNSPAHAFPVVSKRPRLPPAGGTFYLSCLCDRRSAPARRHCACGNPRLRSHQVPRLPGNGVSVNSARGPGRAGEVTEIETSQAVRGITSGLPVMRPEHRFAPSSCSVSAHAIMAASLQLLSQCVPFCTDSLSPGE